MWLGELTDELAEAVEIASGESCDDFSGGINAEAEVSSAQQYATAMLDAMNAGETAQQVQNAISLIAILAEKATTEAALVEEALSGADYRSEEHTSELQSLMRISYAVFCLKKKKKKYTEIHRLIDQII